MVTAFMNRLGNLGLLIVAMALVLGGLAGAAVVHHFDVASSTVASHSAKDGQRHGPDKKPNKRNQRPHSGAPRGPNSAPNRNSQHTD